jgi:ribose/xylose/arabinose/galactoside ABC-type transport system permease subunit
MKASFLKRVAATRELGIGAVLALIVIVISIRSPVFLSLDNLHDIAVDVSILAIMAVGMMMVFVTGGIDISVAGSLAFSGFRRTLP